MINRSILVGRLTRDPELKYTNSGIANLRFTVAVNRTFTNQNGERQADYINCVAWRGQAENMAKFLRKGSLIGVEGRIETGSYQAQDGTTRYTTDVIADNVQFLEPRSATEQRSEYIGGHQSAANPFVAVPSNQPMGNMSSQFNNAPDYSSTILIGDDDLPF